MTNDTQDLDDICANLLPAYDEIVAFDPDEFATAFQWAMNAVSGAALIQDASTLRITLPDEDGARMDYRVADQPETRILIAMLERYGKADDVKCHSAVVRIFALLDFVSQGGLEPWVSQAPGRTNEVHRRMRDRRGRRDRVGQHACASRLARSCAR